MIKPNFPRRKPGKVEGYTTKAVKYMESKSNLRKAVKIYERQVFVLVQGPLLRILPLAYIGTLILFSEMEQVDDLNMSIPSCLRLINVFTS